jgi:hypothetical protein
METSNVTYVPPPNFAGSFAYALSDDWGATASAEVPILMVEGSLPAPQHLLITPTADGFRLRFAGDAGRTYRIERSPDLAPPWTTLDTLVVSLPGLLEYQDTIPPPQTAFYRITSL